ncbi:MAG TPA: thioredoxin family protein [Nitriliruptoraceae bacterium]|nr:thioredoxin family protein [Nitriliruptoraceae bacterium]
MTGAIDRLVVVVVALGVAAVIAWILAARTRRRATSAIVATPGQAARIVAFQAHWCGACDAQRRQLDVLDDIEVRHVDVEQEPDTARRHGIRTLPTTIVVTSAGTVGAINHGLVAAETLRGQLGGGTRAAALPDPSRVRNSPSGGT